MDLQKMNPLARKMMVHSEAFTKALEDGNANAARDHITEVLKFAEYLSHDVSGHIAKAEDIGFTLEPVMVRKMNESGQKFDTASRDRVLPGTVIPARTHTGMRPHHGTFGRYTPQ
jgi:hypothetical protein|tara:strand:+ start:6185 stop:6529 length:345 start_codon:yes stop_codon:yes gene_type:complete